MNAITASILLHHYFVPFPKYHTPGSSNSGSDTVTNGYRELIGYGMLVSAVDSVEIDDYEDEGRFLDKESFSLTARGDALVKFWLNCPLPVSVEAWKVEL